MVTDVAEAPTAAETTESAPPKAKRTRKKKVPTCTECERPLEWRDYAYYGKKTKRCKRCSDAAKRRAARTQVKYLSTTGVRIGPDGKPRVMPNRKQLRAAGVYSREVRRAKPARSIDPARPILHHRAKKTPPWIRNAA